MCTEELSCIQEMWECYGVEPTDTDKTESNRNYYVKDGKAWPRFSPKKQIKLIKLLFEKGAVTFGNACSTVFYQGNTSTISTRAERSFESNFALLLINAYLNLDEDMRQLIKEILEK